MAKFNINLRVVRVATNLQYSFQEGVLFVEGSAGVGNKLMMMLLAKHCKNSVNFNSIIGSELLQAVE